MKAWRSRRRPLSPLTRFTLWAAGIGFALLVVLGAIAGVRLLAVVRDLREARTLLEQAGGNIEQGQLSDAGERLNRAQQLLTRANGRLYNSPEIELIGWVPFIQQNFDSVRDSVGVALRLVDGGTRLLRLVAPLEGADGRLQVPLQNGTIPLATVNAVQQEVESLASSLPTPGSKRGSSLLVGPVNDLQERVYEEATRRRDQLDNVGRALALLVDMSGGRGSRRYLIAVSNTAEIRGAGGMVLSYGILESSRGTFTVLPFGSVDEIVLPTAVDPAVLGLPDDYLNRWDGLRPTELWRNANLAPDFTFVAPVMEAMLQAAVGVPVDGVIQVDPAGLAAILKGTGPVIVDPVGEVTADNVVDITINKAYVDFPDRDTRQEILGDVAEAAFQRLVSGQYASLRPLGEALFEAAAARHVIFHTTHEVAEAQAHFFGADGSLPDPAEQDYMTLTLQNFSRNKLDYYIDTDLSLEGDRPIGQEGRVTAAITVTNTAPRNGRPTYVFGPNYPEETNGLYRTIASLYVPNGTVLEEFDGDANPGTIALTTEAGRTLVQFGLDLPAGESATITFKLRLPPRAPGPYRLLLVPQPRVRPTMVSADIDLGDGHIRKDPTPLVANLALSTQGGNPTAR